MGVKFENGKYYIDEDYIIKNQKHNSGAEPHTHDFIELSYMKKGHCVHIIDGCEYVVGRGDMIFVNYNSVHEIPKGDSAEYINILIKPEFIDRSLKGSENAFSVLALSGFEDFADTVQRGHMVVNFSGRERENLEHLLEIIDSELSENCGGVELSVRSCINILLTALFRKMRLPMKECTGMNAQLTDYIRENCASTITLEEAAAKAGYNPSYFSRLFKKYTGSTFTAYLTDCRIGLAAQLLTETEKSVEEIMYESGFTDRTKFFKAFADKKGMTPLKYRQKNIKGM